MDIRGMILAIAAMNGSPMTASTKDIETTYPNNIVELTIAQPAAEPVTLLVGRQDRGKFRLLAGGDQVARIGELLRGKRPFSFKDTFALPLALTGAGFALTAILSGLIQFISWTNEVSVEYSKNLAAKAEAISTDISDAISNRFYATRLLHAAVSDLTRKDNGTIFSKATFELDRKRYSDYAEMLKSWNGHYSQWVSKLLYVLDRPVFTMVGRLKIVMVPIPDDLTAVDCERPMPEQIDRLGRDKRSLKIQFAVLHYCILWANRPFDERRDAVLADPKGVTKITPDDRVIANKRLDRVSQLADVLRCYMGRRVEFYYREKQYTILSPARIFNTASRRAEEHFLSSDVQCNLS
jgi:hypothetical protein